MKTRNIPWLALILSGVTLAVVFNNCGRSFKSLNGTAQQNLTSSSQVQVTNSSPPAVAVVQPATLAVRGASCLMCHAQVRGTVVSDFGQGDPFFFVGNKYAIGTNPSILGWIDAVIFGNVIVPRQSPPASPSQSIKTLLVSQLPITQDPDATKFGIRGSVIEKDHILIAAPTPLGIQTLTRRSDAHLVYTNLSSSMYRVGDDSAILGLNSIPSRDPAQTYFINDSKGLQCKGDIVILGAPLVLSEVNVVTDGGGCRLYVEHSVFIKGEIHYNGSTGTPNLQISSSRLIAMGIRGLERIEESFDSWGGLRQASTKNAEQAFNQTLYDDRNLVYDSIEDAGPWRACTDVTGKVMVEYDHYLKTAHHEYVGDSTHTPVTSPCNSAEDWLGIINPALKASLTRKIDYKQIVLNAPKIQGRYLGSITGLIIAEDALFSPGNYQINADSTFDQVAVLPLFQGLLLDVK